MQEIKWHQSVAGHSPSRLDDSGTNERGAMDGVFARLAEVAHSGAAQTTGWLLVLAALAVAWWASLTVVNIRNMGELGLLMVLPLGYFLIVVALTVSYSVALRFQASQPVMLAHLTLLIFMIHGTPHLLYGTPRYSWAWKHVGLVDYIQQYHAVDLANESMGAYHNWPGFFSVNALLTQIAGLESSVSYAGWAPVFFNLIFLGALLLIFRASTYDERLIWLGAWFFVLANWVGQDYFAPQAMGFFLHLVIIGCTLWWFRQTRLPDRDTMHRWFPFRWRWLTWLIERLDLLLNHVRSTEPYIRPDVRGQRAGVLLIVALLLATITSSHQLTPFMTVVSLGMLVVFQRTNMRGILVLAVVLTATWLAYGAATYMKDAITDLIAEAVQVQDTLDTGFISLGQASYGQQLIALMGRGLTAGFWALALWGALRRIIHRRWDLSILLLAAAPMVILAGGSYGGEILFRVYFFTLPFMAFLAAGLFFPTVNSGRSWITTSAIILVSLAMLVALGFAYYGKDRQFYFTPEEVAAANYLDSIAPPGSLIVEGTRNYPLRYRNHTQGTLRVAFAREPQDALVEILADPEAVFLRWMSNDRFAASYFIMTRSMKSEIDMVGDMPPGALDVIEEVLVESPHFKVIYANRDATILTLADDFDRDAVEIRDGAGYVPPINNIFKDLFSEGTR